MVIDDESIKIDDVPDSDYQYLKPLLHLELTTLFDKHQISIVRRKSTGKCKSAYIKLIILINYRLTKQFTKEEITDQTFLFVII